MIVVCDKCGAKFKLTVKKKPAKPINFKCGKCNEVIKLAPEQVVIDETPAAAGAPAPIPAAPVPAPAPAAGGTVAVACQKCGTSFVKPAAEKTMICYQCRIDSLVSKVREKYGVEGAPPEVPAAPAEAAPAPVPAEPRYTIRTADGLVLGPIKLRTVTVLAREKRVKGVEEVSKDDGDYKPLMSFPELAELFPELKEIMDTTGLEDKVDQAFMAVFKDEDEVPVPAAPATLAAPAEEPPPEVASAEPAIEPAAPAYDVPAAEPVVEEATPAEEVPAAEPAVEEATPAEDIPAAEPAVEEATPAEDIPAAEPVVEEVSPAEEVPAAEPAVEEVGPEARAAEEIKDKAYIGDSDYGRARDRAVSDDAEADHEDAVIDWSAGDGVGESSGVEPEPAAVPEAPAEILEGPAEPAAPEGEAPAGEVAAAADAEGTEFEVGEEWSGESEDEDEEIIEGLEAIEEPPPDARYRIRYPDGLILGPVKLGTIKELFESGNLTGQEDVQRGDDAWVEFAGLPELADLVSAAGAVADGIIELTETLEEVN